MGFFEVSGAAGAVLAMLTTFLVIILGVMVFVSFTKVQAPDVRIADHDREY